MKNTQNSNVSDLSVVCTISKRYYYVWAVIMSCLVYFLKTI